MEIILTNAQKMLLEGSSDFNVLCVLQNSLTDNTLTLSDMHIGLLYDYCCEQNHEELMNLAINILKYDRNVIKPIELNTI